MPYVAISGTKENVVGYNRSGKRRTQRMKRAKRENARLTAKALAAEGPAEKPKGLVEKVKGVAKGVAEAVGGAVKSAVEAVTGKGH